MEVSEVRYAKSGDVDVAFTTLGEGPVDVVFVPGFISHQELMWELPGFTSQLRRLARYCRIVSFDKRGTGLSSRTLGFGSAAERMDDLRAVMDAAEVERAAIYAVSEGGPLATLFAATYPDRVDRLALYGTYARLTSAPGYDAPMIRDFEADWPVIESGWGSGRIFPHFFERPRDVAAWTRLSARYERNACTPRMAVEILQANVALDVRDAVASWCGPTLVVQRQGDRVVPAWHGRWLAEHFSRVEYLELEGDYHSPLHDDPDEVDEALQRFLGAEAERAPGSDRMLATVVFTDIVGSTERARLEGDDRWRDLLDAHDDLSRRTVERFGGRVVKSTGDGMLALFDSPFRAIGTLVELRDRVAAFGLELRAGVHTGEIERRGDDVGGLGVHIASRVEGHAGPAEIVVSRTVRDLVTGSGIEFVDLGPKLLKGIDEPWDLYAVSSGDNRTASASTA